jgi:hypothetical protein
MRGCDAGGISRMTHRVSRLICGPIREIQSHAIDVRINRCGMCSHVHVPGLRAQRQHNVRRCAGSIDAQAASCEFGCRRTRAPRSRLEFIGLSKIRSMRTAEPTRNIYNAAS